MTRTLCNSYDIITTQEHWLLKDNLTTLNHIDSRFGFVGVSGMTCKSSEGIVSGRPFGGVAILWSKSLASYTTLVEKDEENGIFISIILTRHTNPDHIISCVYFPCLSMKQLD
jgi:hypothetical protein